jgi:hypothetical protein
VSSMCSNAACVELSWFMFPSTFSYCDGFDMMIKRGITSGFDTFGFYC